MASPTVCVCVLLILLQYGHSVIPFVCLNVLSKKKKKYIKKMLRVTLVVIYMIVHLFSSGFAPTF